MLTIQNIKSELENQIVTKHFWIGLVAELSGNATSPKYVLLMKNGESEFEIHVERKRNTHGLYQLSIPKHSNIVSTYISLIDIKDRNEFFNRIKILTQEYEMFAVKHYVPF